MGYKIISLNTWGGRALPELSKFVTEHGHDTDIFCFQEVFDTTTNITESNQGRTNLFNELEKLLPNHTGHRAFSFFGFDPQGPVDFDLKWGLATFTKNNLQILHQQDQMIHQEPPNEHNYGGEPRNIHLIKIHKDQHQPITILNFHGLWRKGFGKGDNADRLLQSKKVQEIIKQQTGPIILTGDFNLHPETESLSIMKGNLRNLIEEFQITNTRSELYLKPERFADYTLISKEIEVESFELPNINASDHLPLILKIK